MKFTVLTAETAATAWDRARRRILLTGAPNAGKTTSLNGFPKPLCYIAAPGEKGYSSLQVGKEDKTILLQEVDATKPVNWVEEWNSFERMVDGITVGKEGKFQTLAIDGLHKLFPYCFATVCNGANMRNEDVEPRLYRPAYKKFGEFLGRIFNSPIEYAVYTVWDGLEKDQSSDVKAKDATQHIFPGLPGQLARDIMGEFSVALYANRVGTQYVWQTKPHGIVWGCGVKIPVDMAAKIPSFVPQDWAKFETLLTGTK